MSNFGDVIAMSPAAFGYRVVATGVPGVTSDEPTGCEVAAEQSAVTFHGTEGVRRAGRVEAAHLSVQGTDEQPVQPEETDQEQSDRVERHEQRQVCAQGHEAGRHPAPRAHADIPAGRLPSCSRRSARLTSRSIASDVDSAQPGKARMTSRVPGASWSRCMARTCRSCRATRCRVTELPTALETMKPTRTSGTPWVRAGPMSWDRCATMHPPGARRPPRTVDSKSRERVMRAEAGSTTSRVRLPVCRGPCGGERTGSTGRRAYACAGGTRASCDAGGCWADRCASLERLHVLVERDVSCRARYRERRHRD